MDFLKNWIFSVCLTLILAVIFSVMTPKGSLGKFYKMIISMFIFVSFLYPVSNAKASDFKIDLPMFNNHYEQQIEDAGKNNTEAIIIGKLKEISRMPITPTAMIILFLFFELTNPESFSLNLFTYVFHFRNHSEFT